MIRLLSKRFLFILVLAICNISSIAQSGIRVVALSCNHLTDTPAISGKPVFGWQLMTKKNGQRQTAWQLIVSSSIEKINENIGDFWDSKKTFGSNTQNITFAGTPLLSSKTYYWKVRSWNNNGKVSGWSKPAVFFTGVQSEREFAGDWITADRYHPSKASPIFRKSFSIQSQPEEAIIHISGLGYYELYVNGKNVGDHVLDPGQTNYDDYAFYVTYDISKYLEKGENTIGVMLGNGWYNQDTVWANMGYGQPIFWAQLDMRMGDRVTQVLSDTSWLFTGGPVQYNNVYAGETYDANREVADWASPLKNETGWRPVFLAEKHPTKLTPQDLPPIRRMKELPVRRFYKTPTGSYIFDMGQNFAGWNRLKLRAPKGTVITLTMSEEIFPDGTLNTLSTGTNATKLEQQETYIAKGGGEEIWEPRFTYHGFRYVEVKGLTAPPTKDLLTGIVVYSSMPAAGTFSCSNEQINKLHELSYWTLIGNLHSIPTDCPQREKCGWLGDSHAMAQSTIYNLDMQSFWLKYLDDIHSTAKQAVNTIRHTGFPEPRLTKVFKEAGLPFMIAPGKRRVGTAAPDWGTAIVQLPWFIYTYYDNKNVLEKFYPDMKQWVEYVGSLAKGKIVYEGLGDWCPPGDILNIDCPVALSSTAFHYNDLNILKKVSGLLGKSEDSILFNADAAQIKRAFNEKFFDESTNSYGSQTANAMALDFGLIPAGKNTQVADAIAKLSKEKFDGFMYAGIFGLKRLFGQLSKNDNEQAAFDILTKKGNYSFEQMWAKYGATTLWEVLPVDTLQQLDQKTAARSHNHPMQAGFDAWFFSGIGGIEADPTAPGFRKIIFAPKCTAQLSWAKCSYQSVQGLIESNWKKKNGKMYWDIRVPVGSVAELHVPKGYKQVRVKNYKNKLIHTSGTSSLVCLDSGVFQMELR